MPTKRKLSTHHWFDGLTVDQRAILAGELERIRAVAGQHHGARRAGDLPVAGWSLYRQPSTKNPPTIIRLHRRRGDGALLQVIQVWPRSGD